MGRTARLVLRLPTYAVVAVVATTTALSVFVLSQNLTLVGDVVLGGSLPAGARLTILLELYPFVGTSYGLASGILLLVVTLLVGVDVAMVVYHVREHGLAAAESGGGAVGVLLGALGAGCAACGSAVLAGLLSLLGVAGALTFLPLDGLEFSALAAVTLLLSIFWLADGMRGGEIGGCPVDWG